MSNRRIVRARLVDALSSWNYAFKHRALRAALVDAERSGLPRSADDRVLIATAWDALGHATRDLGMNPRWAASFHTRAARGFWRSAGPARAALSLLAAAHCQQAFDLKLALATVACAEDLGTSHKAPVVALSAATRRAEVIRAAGNADVGLAMYTRSALPLLSNEAIDADIAAISVIAAGHAHIAVRNYDAAQALIDYVYAQVEQGLRSNPVIAIDLLALEATVLTRTGDRSAAGKINQLVDMCLLGGYPPARHLSREVFDAVDWHTSPSRAQV